jgi:homocysteine S-methyltransferase
MDIGDKIREYPVMLTEGAVVERLRRDPRVRLHPQLAHAAFIYDPEAARVMESVHRSYMDIAAASGLPMLSLTPTWRANPERLRAAGLIGRDVNGDAVRYLRAMQPAFVGGLIGCRGDCYLPAEALGTHEAESFHAEQITKLADAGVDLIFAATLPAACEALGIARAAARVSVPYILSFVVNADATLLDGESLEGVIQSIDGAVRRPPLGYMVNCVHHSKVAAALSLIAPEDRRRILGLQANTSAKSPEELEGSATLESEDPEAFAAGMIALHARFGLRILGGCCGTDASHIQALAGRLRTCHPGA